MTLMPALGLVSPMFPPPTAAAAAAIGLRGALFPIGSRWWFVTFAVLGARLTDESVKLESDELLLEVESCLACLSWAY